MAPPTVLYLNRASACYISMCVPTRAGAGTGFLCSGRSLAGLVLTLEKTASEVTINLHVVKFITFHEAFFLATKRFSLLLCVL